MSEMLRRYGVGRSVIRYWRRQQAVAVLGTMARFTPVAVAAANPTPFDVPLRWSIGDNWWADVRIASRRMGDPTDRNPL